MPPVDARVIADHTSFALNKIGPVWNQASCLARAGLHAGTGVVVVHALIEAGLGVRPGVDQTRASTP